MTRRSPRAKSEEEQKRAREEAQRQAEARRRQELDLQRKLCSLLQFWMFCGKRRCARAHRCADEAVACFDLFWPRVPEHIKTEIRQMIRFRNQGMSPDEAVAAAADYVARQKREAVEP